MITGMFPKILKFAASQGRYSRMLVLVVCNFALLSGSLLTNPPTPVNAQTGSETAFPATTGEAAIPFPLATPASDGAIIHVVEEGQNLITIAQAYKISLAELFSLNSLTDQSVIFPGQKLFIKLTDRTPEPIVTATSIPTTPPPPTPSPTRRPTRTPRSTALQDNEGSLDSAPSLGTPTPSAIPELAVVPTSQFNKLDPMLVLIGGLVGFGALMILFGTMFKRRS